MKRLFLFVAFGLSITTVKSQDVNTLAGTAGSSGYLNGQGTAALFNSPHSACVDAAGNLFVADRYNHRIRKITPSGAVTNFAGSGVPGSTDGTGMAATFNEPWGIAIDTAGNLYIADTKNYKIRKITPAALVTTIAGTGVFGTTNGPAASAQFGFPTGVAVTPNGNIIYISDYQSHVIRKIEAGNVSTLAGTPFQFGNTNATGAAARFDHPYAMAMDATGNIIVTDEWNNLIRRVTPAGVVTTVAGNGSAGSANGNGLVASFNAPRGVCTDEQGNIYVGDGNNYTIRKIETGMVSTYAGITGMPGFTNGPVASATFQRVTGLAWYAPQQKLYAADSYNHLVRVISQASSVTITLTSDLYTVCTGDTVTLTASPTGLTDYSFWEGAVLLGVNQTGVIKVGGLTPGGHNIHCTARDILGITVFSDTIQINVVNVPTASITPSSGASFCMGDSLLLTASAALSYLWNTGATTQSIYAKSAGAYSVTVSIAGGCSAQSPSVNVTVNPVPSAALAVSDSVCEGLSASLAVIQQPGVTYTWYAQATGGSSIGTGNTFNTPILSQTTTYYVQSQGSNGCIATGRTSVIALVYPAPVAAFSHTIQGTSATGLTVAFQNNTSGAAQYLWNFGEPASADNTSLSQNPVHVYQTGGTYAVQLVAVSAEGCADSVLQNVTIARNNRVFIPTAFTPNNDGQNDLFRIRGSNIEAVDIKIYSQWGQLMVHTPLNRWDGAIRGDVAQTGTYLYVVEVEFSNGEKEIYKGQVSVIR